MNNFREKDPQKTSDNDAYDTYGLYKEALMNDFYNNCGYCNDNDFWMGGWRGMQIDHFAPKKPFVELEHTYENLVYSCFYCNNAKSNDWVTEYSDKPVNDLKTKGYVHPRESNYNNLFKRSESGGIVPITDLGLYIYTFLNLGLRRHQILFTITRISKVIDNVNLYLKSDIISNEIKGVLKENKYLLLDRKLDLEKQFRIIISAK